MNSRVHSEYLTDELCSGTATIVTRPLRAIKRSAVRNAHAQSRRARSTPDPAQSFFACRDFNRISTPHPQVFHTLTLVNRHHTLTES